ncbi:formin-like protein 5 [Theropithecus gelada]|uniref:formin-like protein 5 n=1 Tax=Theropithecus gelada TaxID=9565 RepID=UPI000DC1B812|nr:formin-like protein 5 [Theropithecus gelada]
MLSPPFLQLRDGDFRRPGVSSPLGGSSDPSRPHSRAAITMGNSEKPASQVRGETPRLPVAAAANGWCSPHAPPGVASGSVPANASTSNRSSPRRKLAMRLRRGAGVGVGANAKQRRRQRQPEFLPPPLTPPPPPREAAEWLQLHLQQQPASPPPGAPLDLGREQPRQQLETKINSPHPKLRAQRAAAQPRAPAPPHRAAPAHPGGLPGPAPAGVVSVRARVRVCARVCGRHPAAAAYGRVCPAPAPRPRVAGRGWHSPGHTPRAGTAGVRSATLFGRRGGLAGNANRRRRHTPPKDSKEESSAAGVPPVPSRFWWPPPAGRRAQRLSLQGATRFQQHAASDSQNFSGGGGSPRGGDPSDRRVPRRGP